MFTKPVEYLSWSFSCHFYFCFWSTCSLRSFLYRFNLYCLTFSCWMYCFSSNSRSSSTCNLSCSFCYSSAFLFFSVDLAKSLIYYWYWALLLFYSAIISLALCSAKSNRAFAVLPCCSSLSRSFRLLSSFSWICFRRPSLYSSFFLLESYRYFSSSLSAGCWYLSSICYLNFFWFFYSICFSRECLKSSTLCCLYAIYFSKRI